MQSWIEPYECPLCDIPTIDFTFFVCFPNKMMGILNWKDVILIYYYM